MVLHLARIPAPPLSFSMRRAVCLAAVLSVSLSTSEAEIAREQCQDATDAEVRVMTNFVLSSCTAARGVCDAAPAVATACPQTCGRCGRELGSGSRRREQPETPHARHSNVHHAYLGKTFRLPWLGPEFPPFLTWSASKGMWSGFIPDLLAAVCEELGMKFVLAPASSMGGDVIDFLQGRSRAVLSRTLSYGIYGRNLSLDLAYGLILDYGLEHVQQFARTMPVLPQVDLFTGSNTALLRKTKDSGSLWRLFDPFTGALWTVIASAVVAAGLSMACLSIIDTKIDGNNMSVAAIRQRILRTQYHAWATILGGEDFECAHSVSHHACASVWRGFASYRYNRSSKWPQRVFRLGLLFLVLLSTSTYTANLSVLICARCSRRCIHTCCL